MSAADRRSPSPARQALSAAVIALAACTCVPAATPDPETGSGGSMAKTDAGSRIDAALAAAMKEGPGGALATGGAARFDDAGRIQAYVHCAPGTDLAAVEAALAALGASVEITDTELGVVQAWLPTARVDEVGALPGVERLGLPSYGRTR